MKTYGGNGCIDPRILDDNLSVSRPDRFTSDAQQIGGWVIPRDGLDAAEKNFASAVQSVARRYTDFSRLPRQIV
jgi:hypothetical protein